MKDSEFHHIEEDLVNLLASYRDACTEMDLDFEESLDSLIEQSGK
jgi:hypothetical protein